MPASARSAQKAAFDGDPALLNSKFELYKLTSFDQSQIDFLALPDGPSLHGNLPSNAKVAYEEVRARIGWNCLQTDGKSLYYAAQNGDIVRITTTNPPSATTIASIPQDEIALPLPLGRIDSYPYYPAVLPIGSNLLLHSDGLGKFTILRTDGGTYAVTAQVRQPAIVHDAKVNSDSTACDVLITHPIYTEDSAHATAQYHLVHASIDFATSSFLPRHTFTMSEIPRYAVLSTDANGFLHFLRQRYSQLTTIYQSI